MNNNFTQNSIIEDNLPVIKKVIEHGKRFSMGQVFEKFVRHFYKFVPVDIMNESSIDELHAFALNAFKFFEEFKKTDSTDIHQIEVSSLKVPENSKKDESTVIKLLNPDSPFLVDSVIEELSREGYKTHSLIHPIFQTKRDSKGKIQDIFSCHENNSFSKDEYEMESLICVKLVENLSKEKSDILKNQLSIVLSHVKIAVADWKPTLNKLENILQNNKFSDENAEFLKWIENNNFTFLGYSEFEMMADGTLLVPQINHDSSLGICKLKHAGLDALLIDNVYRIVNINQRKEIMVEIRKINQSSLVHRSTNLDAIFVKIHDESRKVSKIFVFIGLFTSVVYYQSATLIPIIKTKISNIIKKTGLSKSSYSGKEIITILEALPRNELFQMEEKELLNIAIGIVSLHASPKLKLHVRSDSVGQTLSCIVFIPKERFSNDASSRVKALLAQEFGGNVVESYTQVTSLRLAYIHAIIKTEHYNSFDVAMVEKKLERITSLWNDHLFNALVNVFGNNAGEELFAEYKNAFPAAYKDKFSPEISAISDIKIIEDELEFKDIVFELTHLENISSLLQLKVYSKSSVIALSEIMPMLDEMGFNTLDESIFLVTPEDMQKQIWLHSFQLDIHNVNFSNLEEIKINVEEAFQRLWSKQMQVDRFNSLILLANLNWRQVTLIRAFSKYLAQINFPYSHNYVAEILAKHSEISSLLVKLFSTKFDPELNVKMSERQAKIEKIKAEINGHLKFVLNSAEDRVLKTFMNLINAVLRTNFYQFKKDENDIIYISFKLDSAKIIDMPSPAPFAEIFVYSPRFEAIHLRGGKVARGGLRWSDRIEDYRTEVLGLVKAQMAKNSVIVPVGSKGGFVIKKDLTGLSREEFMHEGIACYKLFLSSLLDITDNIVSGEIVKPKNVICHDGDDPYLVVAADKGTATFSDIANSISHEYGFWLGDAFASGGSAGYDHKKMGITARGAWVCVKRHFREMGIDIQNTDFTVVGIGDMSGDVFGNGMLLSEHIKLVAAFNHLHIFLDPTPEAAASFVERKRLFETPRSTWKDYNPDLISKGGGIFDRSAKTIKISKEVQNLLYAEDMPQENRKSEMSPEELINLILKAKVDLIWNGGIGTYVKSGSETNERVGDKANDSIRVNGSELRASVFGEGGNLGCTQLGRIEFAKFGGRINTDAIDNSAGVDCSDHEVNIKIALQSALAQNILDIKKRNKLLEEMTDEVAELVLRDNRLQSQVISFEEHDSPKSLANYARLIKILEAEGMLNRKLEFLPNNEELAMRISQGKGMTRPELAVTLAYSKIAVYNNLVNSNIVDEPYFKTDLMKYFPEKLQKKFSEEIQNHPLKGEIIATSVANSIVNRTGCHFFHLALEDTQFKGCDIARAYAITRASFGLREIWEEIEKLDGEIKLEDQLELFMEVKKFLQKMILWYLNNHPHPLKVSEIIEHSQNGIKELMLNLDKVMAGEVQIIFNAKLEKFINNSVNARLAKRIASLKVLASSGDIMQIAANHELDVKYIGQIYFKLGTAFYFDWLRSSIDKLKNMDQYWQKLSLRTLKEDLYVQQRNLTSKLMKFKKNTGCEDPIKNWRLENEKHVKHFEEFIKDLKSLDEIDFSMIIVAAKRLERLIYL